LRLDARAVQRLLLSGKVGLFRLLEISHNELPEIERLRKRYADLPPQLANLAIIHLAHREETDTIFSLDRRDFSVYRYKVRSRFKLLPEEQ
jgi:hypothetical protein